MGTFGNIAIRQRGWYSILSLFFLLSFVSIIAGCGYKPVAQYGKAQLPEPVYVDVQLSGVEPQNGVYLKEEIMRVLRTHFQERVVLDKAQAASELLIPRYKIDYKPLAYDTNGYVIRYRVSVDIDFLLRSPKGQLRKRIRGTEDVNIQPGSLTSDVAREQAIRVAIRKAMDDFIAYVAQKGYGR
jgi:outer membrane lipopolysaccharide assembly protein LptE/RlpB